MRDRDDDDDDDEWDDELDLDNDDDGDDDAATVACPFCGHEIFEDSPRCPSCGKYLSADDFARRSQPLWVFVTALVCLAAALWLAFAI